MTAFALRTRRVLIRDLGRTGVAVFVFGLAACSSDENQASTTSGSPGTDASQPTTTAGSSASTTAGTEPPAPAGYEWHRANLGFVSAYIMARGGEAVLVDTGVEGSADAIGAALEGAGLGWDALGHVVITHKHGDHQGSLEEVLGLAPQATWYAGRADIPQIGAEREPTAVGDGDQVMDLDIIETPGHTPGHISVLDTIGGILVAGDAINGADGGVTGANPQFSEDMDLANASIAKLGGFDYEVVLFGHGEPVLSGGSTAVAALTG